MVKPSVTLCENASASAACNNKSGAVVPAARRHLLGLFVTRSIGLARRLPFTCLRACNRYQKTLFFMAYFWAPALFSCDWLYSKQRQRSYRGNGGWFYGVNMACCLWKMTVAVRGVRRGGGMPVIKSIHWRPAKWAKAG